MKALSITKSLLIGVYAAGGVALAIFLLPFSGFKVLTVATGSMSPAIPKGSLVIIHKAPTNDLRIGDVVTYINPQNTRQTITHRITEKKVQNNLPVYVTKGDANKVADHQILGGNIVGKVEFSSLPAGQLVGLVRTPIGLGLLVIIPALLIIIDELRRLVKVLSRPENGSHPEPTPAPNSQPPPAAPSIPSPHRPTRPKRNIDSIVLRGVTTIAAVALAAGGTSYAALVSNPATLSGNTITAVIPAAAHLQINRVATGSGAGSGACPGGSSSVSISDTAPGSTNNASVNTSCTITSASSNNATATNTTTQTATSGGASQTSNTTGSGTTSGGVSNNSSSSTSISINNGSVSGSLSAFVELYNPTNSLIDLSGWALVDNSGTPRALTGNIAAHGLTLVVGTFGDGLAGGGDRMILMHAAAAIDGVSWGSDNSQLNPAVAAIPTGGLIKRVTLGLDSDQASDWLLVGP